MAKACILAVDDQLYFRVFLEDLLVQEGYEVLTAKGGSEALHLLEREHVDVVLTDLVMPEMSGAELVEHIKKGWPEQDVIVVTSIGDVQTAVDAMRRGATDYLLKPVDRVLLVGAIEGVLQRRRLRQEHAQLMAENLEVLRVLSLYERVMSLFATLTLEPLAERIVEGLCLETKAQGGVLWLVRSEDEPERLRLRAARGLVRLDREPEEVSLEEIPASLTQLRDPDGRAFLTPETGSTNSERTGCALVVPLRHAGALLGFARLTDKLAGASFEDQDRAVAERLAEPAALAVANALRHRALERRSFRDPTTKAYTWAYFEDVVRNEIQKAGRFGRSFSLLKMELDGVSQLRQHWSDAEFSRWLETLAFQIGRLLRSTDLLAVEGDGRCGLLLPETDALGAAVLRRRMRELLECDEWLRPTGEKAALALRLATASFPADGSQIETLERILDARIEEERRSLVHRIPLDGKDFPELLRELGQRSEESPEDALEQILRFVVGEVERRAGERGVLCLAPGAGRLAVVVGGLARLEAAVTRTEVVLVSEIRPDALASAPVTFVSPQRARTQVPFVVYYAEGPAYALVGETPSPGRPLRLFQSSDRVLVEHLAFQLQRDLGIPVGR
jgi:diguanylate cyclase (GGDEF)-like protein